MDILFMFGIAVGILIAGMGAAIWAYLGWRGAVLVTVIIVAATVIFYYT